MKPSLVESPHSYGTWYLLVTPLPASEGLASSALLTGRDQSWFTPIPDFDHSKG